MIEFIVGSFRYDCGVIVEKDKQYFHRTVQKDSHGKLFIEIDNEKIYKENFKKKYKLRFYKISGKNKGNLNHEEFFFSLNDLDERLKEVFIPDRFSLNPTAWVLYNDGWKRLMGR